MTLAGNREARKKGLPEVLGLGVPLNDFALFVDSGPCGFVGSLAAIKSQCMRNVGVTRSN